MADPITATSGSVWLGWQSLTGCCGVWGPWPEAEAPAEVLWSGYVTNVLLSGKLRDIQRESQRGRPKTAMVQTHNRCCVPRHCLAFTFDYLGPLSSGGSTAGLRTSRARYLLYQTLEMQGRPHAGCSWGSGRGHSSLGACRAFSSPTSLPP